MALLLVLWTLVALSVMLAGMTQGLRADLRTVAEQKAMLQARAVAWSALNTALHGISAPGAEATAAEQLQTVVLEEQTVQVVRTPLNGWIDLNQAPAPLLAAVFQQRLDLSAAQANQLAQDVVDLRDRTDGGAEARRFDAVDELMQVPGMSFARYARVADLLTADLKAGSGKVNPLAAPREVLLVLAGGNAQIADDIVRVRSLAGAPPDTSRLDPGWIQIEAGGPFRLQADVPLADGRLYSLAWTIYPVTDEHSQLPWRVVRSRDGVRPS